MEVTTEPTKIKLYTNSRFYIGLGLAVASSVFIGSSFIIKKISLIRLGRKGSMRAGAGGFGYLTDWMWWLGLVTMGVGELANFAAYAFAPASLVTPLGALSVLVSAILATKFLNEKLNLLGKLGCFLCILGSTIIVIHAPKDELVVTVDELLQEAQKATFINYVISILILVLLILFLIGPKYGSKHVIIYLLLCSATGSLTVMACKALGLAIKENSVMSYEDDEPNILMPVLLFLAIAFLIVIQMNYLNKALDLFSTSVVTPIYYVLFTTLVIIASTILFEEWKHMSGVDILGAICGFLVTVVAIFLLHVFKDGSLPQIYQRSNSSQYGSHLNYQARSV